MEFGDLLTNWGHSVVLLSVIVPLFAAVAVPLTVKLGANAARGVALAGSSVSVLLAGSMLVQYDPQATDESGAPVTTQMTAGFTWDIGVADVVHAARATFATPGQELESPGSRAAGTFRVEFGIDGLGLWPAVCVPIIVWCLFVVEWDRWTRCPPVVLSFLFLLESALIGFFAAQDVLTLSICLLSIAGLLPLLLGASGGQGRRMAARRLMLQQWTAALLITAGLAGLVGVHAIMLGAPDSAPGAPTFQIDQLAAAVPGGNSPAGAVWSRIASWLFLTTMIGFFFWSGLAPSHSAAVVAHLEGDTPSQIALTSLALNAGVYGLLRFVSPMFPQLSMMFSPALFFLAACGVLYTSAWMSAERNAPHLIAGAAILWRSLALAGLASTTANGVRGCVLLLPAAMLTSAAYILVQAGAQQVRNAAHQDVQRLSGPTVFVTFAAAALPGTVLFPGALLVLGALAEMPLEPPGGWMLTVLITAGALLAAGGSLLRTLSREDDGPVPSGRCPPFRNAGALAAIALLAGLIITIGIRPGLVLDPAQPTLVELLGLPAATSE